MSIEFIPRKKIADVNCFQKILPTWQFFLRLIPQVLGEDWGRAGPRRGLGKQGKSRGSYNIDFRVFVLFF